MAIRVTRFVGSQNGVDRNQEKKGFVNYTMDKITEVYTVQGIQDQYLALTAVDSVTALAIPDIGDNYKQYPSGTAVTELEVINKAAEQEKSNNIWRVYVTYDSIYRDYTPEDYTTNVGKETWNFRFATGNEHIACIKKLSDRKTYNVDNTSGLLSIGGTAINDSTGVAEGIDILVPSLALTVTKVFRESVVDADFLDNIKSLIGTINSAKWPPAQSPAKKYDEYFGKEDVLLVGTNILDNSDYNDDRSISVTYDFLINPYKTSEDHDVFSIDTDGTLKTETITATKSHGWDLKWVKTKEFTVPVPAAGRPNKEVLTEAVMIDEIYESESWTQLWPSS